MFSKVTSYLPVQNRVSTLTLIEWESCLIDKGNNGMKVNYHDIETAQLQAFVMVAQEYSFTRAAERLNLSQPSLSARIQQLEYLLDCTACVTLG